jgi:hypothetical protein
MAEARDLASRFDRLAAMSVPLTIFVVLFALAVGYLIGRLHMTSVLAPAKDRAEVERNQPWSDAEAPIYRARFL